MDYSILRLSKKGQMSILPEKPLNLSGGDIPYGPFADKAQDYDGLWLMWWDAAAPSEAYTNCFQNKTAHKNQRQQGAEGTFCGVFHGISPPFYK